MSAAKTLLSLSAPRASNAASLDASLKVGFAWTFVGTAIYAACNWGMLAVLAKLGGAGVLGEYAFGVAVATPIFMLTNVNLRAVLATDFSGRYPFAHYLEIRYLSSLLALLSIGALAYLQRSQPELALVMCLVGMLQAIEASSDIHWGLLQRDERMKEISYSMMGRGVVSLFALTLGLAFGRRVTYALGAVVFARLLILTLFDMRNGGRVPAVQLENVNATAPGKGTTRKTLLWTALPLGLVLMFSALSQYIPTYVVKRYQGLAEVGIWASIASLLSVGTTAINALGQSATPRLARRFSEKRFKDFRRLVFQVLAVGGSVGLCGVGCAYLFGPRVLRIMYRPEYARNANILIAVMAAGVFIYLGMLMGYASTAARAFKPQAPLFAIVAGIAATTSLLLVPKYGLRGAAASIGIAGIVHFVGETLILCRTVKRAEEDGAC